MEAGAGAAAPGTRKPGQSAQAESTQVPEGLSLISGTLPEHFRPKARERLPRLGKQGVRNPYPDLPFFLLSTARIRIMRSLHRIQNPFESRKYTPKCTSELKIQTKIRKKYEIIQSRIFFRILVCIFGSEVYFGVSFRASKGFVFCTGTAGS